MVVDYELFKVADEIAARHARKRFLGGVDIVAKIRLRTDIYNALATVEAAA